MSTYLEKYLESTFHRLGLRILAIASMNTIFDLFSM